MMVPSGAHIAPLTCVLLCMCAQVGFRHPKDYVSYVWARSDDGERCLEKQLCAQVSWGQPCCLAGTSAPRCGRQWPVCAPGWGRQGTSLLLCAEPGAGSWCWQQICAFGWGWSWEGEHLCANPGAHQVSLGCR